jgi:hypothetical protein
MVTISILNLVFWGSLVGLWFFMLGAGAMALWGYHAMKQHDATEGDD